MEVHEVTVSDLRELILSGQLQVPSICAFYMGLEVLQERGLL